MPQGDIWWDILGQDPYTAYQAFANKWGGGRQKSYYQQNFNRVHSQYLSDMGSLMRRGQVPQEDFPSWLNRFNFKRNWNSLPPFSAGRQTGGPLNPYLRWLDR